MYFVFVLCTRTDEALRQFLTAHRGKNFVKTHMKDTQR